MTDMGVSLEAKCTATHKWFTIAHFTSVVPAADAARAFSKLYGHAHRVTDQRWPDEGEPVYVFEDGEMVA